MFMYVCVLYRGRLFCGFLWLILSWRVAIPGSLTVFNALFIVPFLELTSSPQNAFVQLSLAFRNDNYTLEMRLKQAERERNLTEEDTEKELEEFKGALKVSSWLLIHPFEEKKKSPSGSLVLVNVSWKPLTVNVYLVCVTIPGTKETLMYTLVSSQSCSKILLHFLQMTSPQWQNLEQREAYQRLIETVAVLHRLATRLSSRAEIVGAVRQVRFHKHMQMTVRTEKMQDS